jgi:photosystem II stability/assembly factor-like uncharacterized protein
MLLIDEPQTASGDADALIEEARRRTRKRRRRIAAVVVLAAVVGTAIVLEGGGGGGSARSHSGGHGGRVPGGAVRGAAQSVAAGRLAVLPNIGEFGLVAPGEGWAVNGLSFYFTSDDGAHWKTLRVPRLTGGDIVANLSAATSVGRDDIFLSYPTRSGYGTCYRTGRPPDDVDDISSVARSTDRGRTWQLSTLPGCSVAPWLSFPTSRTGFALTTSNTAPPLGGVGPLVRAWLVVTRDGGRTWRRVAQTPFAGQIEFATATDGWGVARPVAARQTVGALLSTLGGALYRTTNGGRSWQRQPICTTASTPGTFTICGQPRFFGPNRGVLPVTTVDRQTDRKWQTIYRTTNAGRTWTAASRLPNVPAGRRPLTQAGQAGKFVAVTATTWIDLIEGRQYTTSDAGSHWTTLIPRPAFSASQVTEFDFASPNDGWLLANPTTFDYTTDGGRTWHPLGRQ